MKTEYRVGDHVARLIDNESIVICTTATKAQARTFLESRPAVLTWLQNHSAQLVETDEVCPKDANRNHYLISIV
jgi:hypothetical protein